MKLSSELTGATWNHHLIENKKDVPWRIANEPGFGVANEELLKLNLLCMYAGITVLLLSRCHRHLIMEKLLLCQEKKGKHIPGLPDSLCKGEQMQTVPKQTPWALEEQIRPCAYKTFV